jgi:hypothetical protein
MSEGKPLPSSPGIVWHCAICHRETEGRNRCSECNRAICEFCAMSGNICTRCFFRGGEV